MAIEEAVAEPKTAVEEAAAQAEKLAKREAWRRRLPLLPALIFTIVVTQVPFLFTLWYSFNDYRLAPPVGPELNYGENYKVLVEDSFFRDAVWTSVLMTTSAVILSLLVGLGLALLLDRKFFGQGFARTLLITPFLVMPVVAGLIWDLQLLDTTFGIINWLLETLGMERISFVGRYPLWSIVAVLVWQWSPFMMLILLAGLQGQNPSVLEAARVDGATPRGIFRQITLPHLRPFMELGILLGAIYLVQVFDHIRVMTGGGPGSTNIPWFVFRRSVDGGNNFGQASAYSIVVVVFTIILATIGLRTLTNLLEDED